MKTTNIGCLALTVLACSQVFTVRCQLPTAHYTLLTDSPQQTIMHFGASDAWSMDKLGLWPMEQQEEIADWLFSLDCDESGQPKGIGLSIWRFNLGAGSAEQGDDAQINPSTRTECFLTVDGTYDWSKQAGQRSFLRLAKERGMPHFLAFQNSQPVHFTKNGLATNTGRDGTINLRDDAYDDAAQFAATALKGIEEHDGIHFDYFCPVNEPDGHWNWLGPKQEGSPATNREVARLAKAMSKAFRNAGLSTNIMVNESSDIRCLLGTHETDWQRGHALSAFFSKDSAATYLGNTPGVPNVIMAHSYWTNTPIDYMREIRQQLRSELRRLGLRYWQTELCIMGNDEEIGGGSHFDFSMLTALYVARVIHHDLVYGNAESWSWWRSVGGDYRDGLIRVYSGDHWLSGRALPSKLLWAMGNYSRFVRPGAVRHDIILKGSEAAPEDSATDPRGLMLTAFRNADGQWVVVAINYSEAARPVEIGGVRAVWKAYRTSDKEGESLKPVGLFCGEMTLEPRSVTTLVAEAQD